MDEKAKKSADRDAYSVAEAAQRLGVSVSHMWRMIREGKVHESRFGARVLISRWELRRLLGED